MQDNIRDNTIEINLKRLEYCMTYYGFTRLSLLEKIQPFYKTIITEKDIFSSTIKLRYLKKIDQNIFKKGLSFYTDSSVIEAKDTRIFFRKNNFNTPISLGDREIIDKIEEELLYINGLSVLANEKKLERSLRIYGIKDNPQTVAETIRAILYPTEAIKEERDFLKTLIANFAEKNIFVFEFIEQHNKKEKSNLNGCFIAPNAIIIKRQQNSFKREIFTLAHELGHYLLDEEELDQIDFQVRQNQSAIEQWCNKFAFAFLTGSQIQEEIKNYTSNPNIVNLDFLKKYHVSRLAFLTHLADGQAITWEQYFKLKELLDREYQEKARAKELKKIQDQSLGNQNSGRSPMEIISPLKEKIYKSAYFEGVIQEAELIKKLKLNRRRKNFEEFIYE